MKKILISIALICLAACDSSPPGSVAIEASQQALVGKSSVQEWDDGAFGCNGSCTVYQMSAGNKELTVSFSKWNSGQVVDYSIYVSTNSNVTDSTHMWSKNIGKPSGGGTHNYNISNVVGSPLINNTTYYVRVYMHYCEFFCTIHYYRTWDSNPTLSGTPFFPPPTGLSAGTPGDHSLSYSWNVSSGASGYRLFLTPSSTINTASFSVSPPRDFYVDINPASATSYVANVENGLGYYAHLVAIESGQLSPAVKIGPHSAVDSSAGTTGHRNYLSDTGITKFANDISNSEVSQPSGFPGQDGDTGRDEATIVSKVNSLGDAGFDYTKLKNDGLPLAVQSTAWQDISAGGSESNNNHWSCIRDNMTGLVWQSKTDLDSTPGTSLHDADDRYTWYDSNANTNAGDAGYDNRTNQCFGYSTGNSASYCNTQAYVARVNSSNLCGFNDWRLPSKPELSSIINYGKVNSAIDSTAFPNTSNTLNYWTSSSNVNNTSQGIIIKFNLGNESYLRKRVAAGIRLVRGNLASE